MNEPRPTTRSMRPLEIRSSVANCWKTRTGSAALSTVTALPSRMREVRAAAAAEDHRRRGVVVLLAVVLADPEGVEARRVGERDLLQQVLDPLLGTDRRPVAGSVTVETKLSTPTCMVSSSQSSSNAQPPVIPLGEPSLQQVRPPVEGPAYLLYVINLRPGSEEGGGRTGGRGDLAVEVGFEPTEGLHPHTLSRRARSATTRLHRGEPSGASAAACLEKVPQAARRTPRRGRR